MTTKAAKKETKSKSNGSKKKTERTGIKEESKKKNKKKSGSSSKSKGSEEEVVAEKGASVEEEFPVEEVKAEKEAPVTEEGVDTSAEETSIDEASDEEDLVEEDPSSDSEEKEKMEEITEKDVSVEEGNVSYKGFNFERDDLDFQRIEKHPQFPNCRHSYPAIEDLERSILETGLNNPLTVWEYKLDEPARMPWGEEVTERYFLIAGFRRHQAITQIQVEEPDFLKTVPVHVFRGPLKDAIFVNLTENVQRENPNALELGMTFANLVDNQGMQQVEVAEQLGVSAPYVSQILKFYRGKDIAPELRELVETNQLDVWMALRVSSQPVEQQIKIVQRLKDALENNKGDEEIKAIKSEIKKNKTPSKKKLRVHKEVQETFDKFLIADHEDLPEDEKAFISGVLKAMHWMLNNDVDWDDHNLYADIDPEVFEEARIREEGRSKPKKSKKK